MLAVRLNQQPLLIGGLSCFVAGSNTPTHDTPTIHTATMMLPFPWATLANVSVVKLRGEMFVVLGDFHAQVLHVDGPMYMSMDVLRTRLDKTSGTQVVCHQDNDPIVLAMLKSHQVLGTRAARAKLVSLTSMETALLTAGKNPAHVALIIEAYKKVVAPQQAEHPQGATPPANPHPAMPPSATDSTPIPQPSSVLPHVEHASLLPAASSTSSLKRTTPSLSGDGDASWARGWPLRLPELAFPPKALREDYCLATLLPTFHQDTDIPLSKELIEFREWCTTPVHLGRGTSYPNPVANITFEGCEDVILGFMGFMLKVSSGK